MGKEHPDTLISLSNLAYCYFGINDNKKAVELLEQCYKLKCKALGRKHPDTIATLENLEYIRNKLK